MSRRALLGRRPLEGADAARGVTRRRLLGGAGGLALGLASCRRSAAPLRIGINLWPGYELLYLAAQRGLFAAQGLDVEIVEFGSLGDTRRAFEFGRIDALATTPVEVLFAREATGRDLRIALVLDESTGGDMLVGARELTSPAELRGKRVGVELASLGVYLLGRSLELHGATLDEVTLTSRDQRAMRASLLAGELDAVVTYPPESVGILADPRFRTLFSSARIPGEVVDVLAIDTALLRTRPALLAQLRAGVEAAFGELERDREGALASMAKREGVSVAEFEATLRDGMRLVRPGEQDAYLGPQGTLRAVVDRTADFLRRAKQLSSSPTECLWP